MNSHSHRQSLQLIFPLLLLFVCAKYVGPAFIDYLYQTEHYSFLNLLTQAQENKPLGYYLGQGENLVFGPLSILASGLALLVLLLSFFKKARPLAFWGIVAGYFVLTRPEVLLYPPYGDAVSGPLVEAWWLLTHSFDYAGLARQPGIVAGGPKIYLFSVYPTVQALLLTSFPNATVYLIVNHLISFALAAGIVTLFREIIRTQKDEDTALLLSVLLLSLPLFQAMAEAINMEMPLVFFSVWAVYFCTKKNILAAAVASIIAALLKGVGILICGVVFVYAVYLFLFDTTSRFRWKTLAWGCLTVLFVAVKLYVAFFVLNDEGHVPMVGLWQGWKENSKLPVFSLYFGSLGVFIGRYLWGAVRRKEINPVAFLRKHEVLFIMHLAALAWFALFLQSYGAQYRYRLLLAPFSLYCIITALFLFIKGRMVQKVFLIVCIMTACWGSYGVFMSPPNKAGTNHSAMERSLEYRNDLKVHMALIKEIEEKYAHMTISAPFTLAQALAFPRFGYVSKELDVMMYGYPILYGGIKNFEGLTQSDIPRTLWIGFETDLNYELRRILEHYPYGPGDKIIKRVDFGKQYGVLFMGGKYVERSNALRKVIYANSMRKKASDLQSGMSNRYPENGP